MQLTVEKLQRLLKGKPKDALVIVKQLPQEPVYEILLQMPEKKGRDIKKK